MDIVPQLDFSLYPSQVFWFFVAFLLLYVVVRSAVLPGIRDVISQRLSVLDGGIEESAMKYREIEKELARQRIVLESAEKDAQKLFECAREELAEMSECVSVVLASELTELQEAAERKMVDIARAERRNLVQLATGVAFVYCAAVGESQKIRNRRLRELVSKMYGGGDDG